MVWWNDASEGAPIGPDAGVLLGYALDCQACGRRARIRQAEAVLAWGPEATPRAIAQRLRCTGCGARAGGLMAIPDPHGWQGADRPESYWGPSPAWPEVTAAGLARAAPDRDQR
jgi:hypothetical protein